MTTRVRIDIPNRVFEAEGSDSFVMDMYKQFVQLLANTSDGPVTKPIRPAAERPETSGAQQPRNGKSLTKRAPTTTPERIDGLNLRGGGSVPGLKDFLAEKKPRKAMEHNTAFTYYLIHHAKVRPVTSNHIYTCYREMAVKPPKAFNQSLWDTASRNDWLNTRDLANVTLTVAGENLVTHDLPRRST